MQKKYNFGRARWGEIVKNSPEKARRIFCEAVDSIITDFAPRLQRWKRKKSNIKNSANILSTEPCPSTSPHVLTGSSQSESDLLNKDSLHPIWIQGSRKEVEQKFTFITIKESPDRPTVEDVGTSRAAIVVYTLYIYALSSFRIFAEPVPYNGPIFSRVTRQYPRVQLSQTLRMLFSNHLMTYAKSGSMAETEFRIFGSMRIKLSSRFLQWAFFEYNTQIKHILEAESVASSVKKRMDAIIWRSKEKPSSVSVEAQTLIEHSFDGVTTGGLVAFVLELMLFDKSVDFLMSFNISDIAFIGDRSLASALDRYHEKLAEAMLSASGPSTTLGRRHSDTGSSGEDTPVEAVRPSEPLVNRKFFYEAQQIAEGLANPDLSSNFCRRSRWYDHHLSFSGGKLTVRFRKLKESRKTVEHKDSFVSVESWLGGIHSRVKPTLDHAVRPRIISPVEMMYKSNAREPSEQSGLLGSVEQAVFQGRFSGRTTSELKVQFGDTHELATVLQDLVITEKIYWLGTSISRFVHCKYIRLWLIHLKPKMAKTVTSRPTANDTVDMDASWDSPSEPRPKRARLTCSGRSNTATDLVDHSRRPSMNTRSTASTVLRRADSTRGIPSNNSEEGFFFPECWCAEDGRIKPQMFCNCLQALVVILAQNSGITLERFALKHQEMAGQQTVRRLLFWLKEMGAVKLFRMKKLSKPALFSPPPVYSLSDDVILASADELVLIAQPDCISTVGTFCRDYLSASGKNDVT
ncbi:unnamed protein product [Calicophoron daubneyi]|uniref:GP-PDE domain-containing protein n=1 Tax=Calicophoron daubneyi TaxID=300641 RepID=A0AAV2T9Q1_CALDB